MGKNLKRRGMFKGSYCLFSGLILSGLLMFSGPGFLNYPCFAEIKGLSGPLYQENIEPHPIDPNSLQGKIIKVVEEVSPAVVSISTEKTVRVGGGFEFPGWEESPFDEFFRHFFEDYPQREYRQKGLGSGMIINKDGYILTNEHVIHEADKDKIKVTLTDGRTLKAEIVATDEESDMAVLKVKGDDLPVITLGDSDNLKVGQWAIAVGNPFGFALSQLSKRYEPTVTVGVISATGRVMQAGGRNRTYTDLIQTDAAINPGNSGGPLINIWGEVIGINTAILTPSGGSIGIGFAISINKAKKILQSLMKYGEVRWPWVGIAMQELTPELSERLKIKEGVQIVGVEKGGPADKAGVKPGDILVKINGKMVTSIFEAREEILKAKIGEAVLLTVMRNGEKLDIPVMTVKKEEEREKMLLMRENYVRSELLGIEVQNIISELKEKYKLLEGETGVVITDMDKGSPVSMVGLGEGDVIKSINQEEIKNVNEFKEAMKKVKPGDMIYIGARHGRWNVRVSVYTQTQK